MITSPPQKLKGRLRVPGDKSISHRAAIAGALAGGVTEVSGFLASEDCLSTLNCLRELGVQLKLDDDQLFIKGCRMELSPPRRVLDAGNSGTTARLLLGVLSGQPFQATLTGDESLKRRPMGRVIEPLCRMGVVVTGQSERLPLTIRGGRLKAISYRMPVASAQLKSALLLAGLYASGITSVEEPYSSRNHTELMLRQFGARVVVEERKVFIEGGTNLNGCSVQVPGDISSAAFFLVAAAIVPGAELLLENTGVNPTRAGILEVLQEMGASIELQNSRFYAGEPVADILVKGGAPLRGLSIGGELIPRLIDELPVLTIAAAVAEGETVIRDAAELRVKESDRITSLAGELARIGAAVEELPDGLRIRGGRPLRGALVESHGDHRLAMSLAVAGLAASGEMRVQGAEAIDISYPGFISQLRGLTG